MSLPVYPLTMPTSPSNFTTSEWRINRSVAFSESPFTYSQQVSEFQGAKWSTVVTLPPMKREDAGAWQSFFMQLHGRKGTFLLGDPDAKSIKGTATGTMKVKDDHSVGAYDITVDGLNASQSKAFAKGDYVQFGSGASSRLHMIIDDISTDGSGNATLKIEPPIKTALLDNSTVVYSSTKAVMRMDANELMWSSNHLSIYGISFSASEVL